VYVSVETLTTIVGIVSVLASLAAGFAWMIRRMDALEEKLSGRIDAVEHEVVEVKIAVARLEGPQQRLIMGR
jgi:hypothetical protein